VPRLNQLSRDLLGLAAGVLIICFMVCACAVILITLWMLIF
jgi:hypothetical protein